MDWLTLWQHGRMLGQCVLRLAVVDSVVRLWWVMGK
jgi:hypothetical protein